MPRKILIVDDEYSFAEFASMLLRNDGYETLVCLYAKDALRLAMEEKPDLILMDVAMPGLSGLEAIRLMKAEAATRDIPIVLCSMTKKRSEVDEAFTSGAVDFVPKPLKIEELKKAIKKALPS